MKLERMLSIITYLLSHERVKAQDLADKFEVSVRTIYRDIEAISLAGIPVIAYQGINGGIGIVEGYKFDKSVFTSDEVTKIVAGLQGLQSISEDVKIKLLLEKLNGIAGKSGCIPAGNEIMIDLSSWNKNDLLGLRIQEIKKAIQERKTVEFLYFSNDNLTKRRVEPCVIVFKEANWYLYAFCLLRQDFRLFKLRRMNELRIEAESFEPREFQVGNLIWEIEPAWETESKVVLLFNKCMKYTVNDIFGLDNYEIEEDGRLKVTFRAALSKWFSGFLLGFGDDIEVLEPAELREDIYATARGICRVYEDEGQDNNET